MTTEIDMTPTFEQATRMCIVTLLNGNHEGRKMAQDELLRYSRELDRLAGMAGSSFGPDDTAIEGE